MIDKVKLGKTDLLVSRSGFGCIPIQRISMTKSDKLLKKAFKNGIIFYDTARSYTDSEEKIGHALSGVRSEVIIATKSKALDKKGVLEDIEKSLINLKTDYVDLLQLHNPDPIPDPDDPDSPYGALIEAKKTGITRFVGITAHKYTNAKEAVKSDLYDTLQFPLSAISNDHELELIGLCKSYNVGLIAMKALAGGLISNVAATFAFLRQYENVVPIWGIQKEWHLDEYIRLEKNPPVLDKKLREAIEKDRKELADVFCRGCGYCLPCPAEIPIPMAARMGYLLHRSPHSRFINKEVKEKMDRIDNCQECGHCEDNCPYELTVTDLLKKSLFVYRSTYLEVKGHY